MLFRSQRLGHERSLVLADGMGRTAPDLARSQEAMRAIAWATHGPTILPSVIAHATCLPSLRTLAFLQLPTTGVDTIRALEKAGLLPPNGC